MTELLVPFPDWEEFSYPHRKQTCWNLEALTDLSSILFSYSYKPTPLPTTQIHGGPEG